MGYAEDPAGVTVDFAAAAAADDWRDTDALSGIEHAVSTRFSLEKVRGAPPGSRSGLTGLHRKGTLIPAARYGATGPVG